MIVTYWDKKYHNIIIIRAFFFRKLRGQINILKFQEKVSHFHKIDEHFVACVTDREGHNFQGGGGGKNTLPLSQNPWS